ncbi:hypothetical protein ABKV19_021457 [Rosa sericea]
MLETRLNELLRREESFWRQRAKIFWLSDGDLNTKFFHQRASNRRKKNTLSGLFNAEGVWCTKDQDLEEIVLDYFQELFSSSHPAGFQNVLDAIPQFISHADNVALTQDFDAEEIYRAIKGMHPSKAPGPDGFAPCFYQAFWDLVGDDVVRAVRDFVGSEDKLKVVNETVVALIPKVDIPQHMHQLRPISLCNVLYKIGSKVLANRLKPLLNEVISPFQSAFVPGRLISDNSLLAFEVSHCLKRRRSGKKAYCALKLDMSKAYDRVEWEFLEVVMLKMGFCNVWVNWVMASVRTVSYSFIVNGDPRGRIIPSRGLRQGDAISPYLFLLVAEALSRLIMVAERDDRLHGVEVCRGAPSISHLFFADDSFIFFKAEAAECMVLKGILQDYENASGQQVNLQKSCISFSKNVALDCQEELASLLGVTRVEKHDKYLGLPTEISYSKEEAFAFLNEKIRARTQGWREKTLSVAGREVLIKAVAQAIPSYVMSCFELPKHLCNEMQQLMARFWWGGSEGEKKIHWVSWEKLCRPKVEGGMGFRNMHCFNLALLAKQGWRLIQKPNSLIARVLKAKYFPHCSFMAAEMKKGSSYTWRSIMAGREVLRQGVRYQVGDGSTIFLWHDPWMPMPSSFRPFSPIMEGTENWVVADVIDADDKEWVVDVLSELFTEMEVTKIAAIPLSIRPAEDRMVWHYDGKGVYNVRSGYHVMVNSLRSHAWASTSSLIAGGQLRSYWNKLWQANVPPKVKVFTWRLLNGALPTRSALFFTSHSFA